VSGQYFHSIHVLVDDLSDSPQICLDLHSRFDCNVYSVAAYLVCVCLLLLYVWCYGINLFVVRYVYTQAVRYLYLYDKSWNLYILTLLLFLPLSWYIMRVQSRAHKSQLVLHVIGLKQEKHFICVHLFTHPASKTTIQGTRTSCMLVPCTMLSGLGWCHQYFLP